MVYISMFLLILLFGLLCQRINAFAIGKAKINTDILFAAVSFFAMAYVEGMRAITVGSDLSGYVLDFMHSQYFTFSKTTLLDFNGIEPGFLLLMNIIYRIAAEPHFFILITSIIIVGLHVWFLYKNSNDFFISILLFIGFNFFFTSMVSLRQFIALGIVMWCYPLARQKNLAGFIFVAVLAMYFHMSSIILAFIIFIITRVKFSAKVIIWMLSGAALSIPLVYWLYNHIVALFNKYEEFYYISTVKSDVGKLRTVYIIIQILVVMYIYFKEEKNEVIILEAIILIIAAYIGIVSSVIPYAFRLGYYFDYFMLLIVPKIISEQTKYKSLLKVITIIGSISLFGYYLSSNPGNVVPYSFYK